MAEQNKRITQLLTESPSSDELLPLVYDELRKLASARLRRERAGQTLQPTALVHEAYLRVVGSDAPTEWEGRRHFFLAAAEAMRRILIERARRKKRARHGGELERVELADHDVAIQDRSDDVLIVHEALARLEEADPDARQLVNLRYFTGLTNRETAEVLGVSVATVEREWRFVRVFLQDALREDGAERRGPDGGNS